MVQRKSVLGVFFLVPLLVGGTAAAQGVPDPANCTVPNVVYSPGGTYSYVVNVRDNTNAPLFGVVVDLWFSAEADSLVCWCEGQDHPVIWTVTDMAGDATFNIFAGGCLDPAQMSAPYTVQVWADTVIIGEVGAVSPDAGDGLGNFPWEDWVPGGGCGTGVSDGVYHTAPIVLGTYSFCSDINSDLTVGLVDAVFITPSIVSGECCNQEVAP